ncbi:unnamed protein product, partial [marine sediment metagenome]
ISFLSDLTVYNSKLLTTLLISSKEFETKTPILSTVIAIDTPAGPSEILIIADETANFKYVIMDFISQIEHDPDNIGVLVSNSLELINKV